MNPQFWRDRSDRTDERTDIWLDTVVAPLGFEWLSNRLPWNLPASVLYAVLAVTVTNSINLSYALLTESAIIYTTNPYYVLEVFLLPAAVVTAHSLHRQYEQAMDELKIEKRATNPSPLLNPIPDWFPWGLFGIAVALQFIFPGPVSTYGPGALFDNFIVLPFVYTPIVVQFFTTYFTIEIIVPIRLWQSDVGIDFLDPEGVGGLRPVGELLKKSYYYLAIGLIGYALITYAPFIDWGWTVDSEANLLFTSIWIVTVGGIGFGVFVLHRFMHREKRDKIRQLKEERRSHMENPYDVTSYEIPEGKEKAITDLTERINRVNETSEYPATFSIWSQLLLSIILPKAFQYMISGL